MPTTDLQLTGEAQAEYAKPEPKTFVTVTYEINDDSEIAEVIAKVTEFGTIQSLNVSKNGGFYF